MKLRIAVKITAAIGTDRESAYTGAQKWKAMNRVDRTRSSREAEAGWNGLMRWLGPVGRAKVLAGTGAPAKAIDLLMRTPEAEWKGDPAAWPFTGGPS
jgi:hypothetical protein